MSVTRKQINRFLKDWGVYFSSERRQRKHAQELVGDILAAEAIPFTFPLKSGGEELRAAPMVYTPDLITKIFDLLDQNASALFNAHLS